MPFAPRRSVPPRRAKREAVLTSQMLRSVAELPKNKEGVFTVPPVISNRPLAYSPFMGTSLFNAASQTVSPFAARWPTVIPQVHAESFGNVGMYSPPVTNTSAGWRSLFAMPTQRRRAVSVPPESVRRCSMDL